MRICIVAPYFTPFVRGNEFGLAQSLTELGNDVTVLTSTARAPREGMVAEGGSKLYSHDFKVEYLPTISNIGENPMTPSVFTNVLKNDCDVILLQEDYPYICHLAYLAAKIRGIPTVLSTERTYYPGNFARNAALKILDKTINKVVRDGVDIMTAHCTAAKEFMIKELGVKREIKVIHVGVDTKLFKPMKSNEQHLTSGKVKILTVARLHKYKGLDYLIKAMSTVHEEMPDAKLYILGKGPEEQNLRNLVKNLALEDVIEFIKTPIPNHEMPEVYAECDVYIQPSIIEPFGIAVLEAMACGKPVIGAKVGGMMDTIVDGETGFLVNSKDSKALANQIRALNDEKLRKKLGKNARERAVEHFDLMKIGAEYQELLRSLHLGT